MKPEIRIHDWDMLPNTLASKPTFCRGKLPLLVKTCKNYVDLCCSSLSQLMCLFKLCLNYQINFMLRFHRTIRTIRTMLMKCWKLSWSNMWQLNISEKVRLSKTIQNYFNYHSWQPSTEPVKIPLTYPISWNTSWLIDFPFYIIIIIPELYIRR